MYMYKEEEIFFKIYSESSWVESLFEMTCSFSYHKETEIITKNSIFLVLDVDFQQETLFLPKIFEIFDFRLKVTVWLFEKCLKFEIYVQFWWKLKWINFCFTNGKKFDIGNPCYMPKFKLLRFCPFSSHRNKNSYRDSTSEFIHLEIGWILYSRSTLLSELCFNFFCILAR